MHSHKILNIATSSDSLREELAGGAGVSGITAQLLINRGISTVEDARYFMNAQVSELHDPFCFKDMRRAVELVKQAIARKDTVMLFGDYDADGITSIAVLRRTLARLGARLVHYLPHRIKEGYGLTATIAAVAKEQGVKLLITADCGISNHRQIASLAEHGIAVIITDHHEPPENGLPRAEAIINPKVRNSGYPYRDLAGVGVAFKLCQAVSGEDLRGELDLVALGTIADSAPLTGENRIIAREGLRVLADSSRPGIKALLGLSGFKRRTFDATSVSFILAPRINAAGRMSSAEASLSLLLSESDPEAEELAKKLETYNRRRQKIEGEIYREAQEIIDSEINFKEHKVIVVAKENWHHGVLGIVASKLADRFYRPVVVISLEDGACKGSARSIKNFHLYDALTGCGDLLDDFGGHAHAAGLVIAPDNIKDFRDTLNRLAHDRLRVEDLLPRLDVDCEVGLEEVNEEVIAEVELLAPFGAGNPSPLLYTRNLRLKGQPRALARQTLKFWVTDGRYTYQALGFGLAGLRESLVQAEQFSMVYTPRLDTWGGMTTTLLEVRDIFFR